VSGCLPESDEDLLVNGLRVVHSPLGWCQQVVAGHVGLFTDGRNGDLVGGAVRVGDLDGSSDRPMMG
jgi:hypothetical protein